MDSGRKMLLCNLHIPENQGKCFILRLFQRLGSDLFKHLSVLSKNNDQNSQTNII